MQLVQDDVQAVHSEYHDKVVDQDEQLVKPADNVHKFNLLYWIKTKFILLSEDLLRCSSNDNS